MAALPTFWKHLLTVLGGSLAAQALPIVAAPLITRLCTPGELGAFSVWLGVVAIAAVAATLRMEFAMVVDPGRIRQRLCFGVVAWSSTWLAVVLTVALVAARLLDLVAMSWPGVLTLGLAAWLTAAMQTSLAYAASHNGFAAAAKARIVAAGGVAGAQLGLLVMLASLPWLTMRLTDTGGDALLAGQLVGLAAGLLAARRLLHLPLRGAGLKAARLQVYLRRLHRQGWAALLPTTPQRRYLRHHRAFWRFTLPSSLLNAAVGQLPLLIIGARHGVMAAGLFALTQRVLAAPISLLAASVLEVFKRESVRQYQEHGDCRPAYRHALRVLLALGAVPASVLWVASPALFSFVFGADWRGAGELAQIMAPLFFLNFVAGPLSYVFSVAGRQKIELLWQVALFATTVAAFAAPLSLAHNVLAYSIGYSLLYLVYLHLSYRYALDRPPGRRLHAAG
ncbi:hypothetical protein ASF04_15625 [Duganella sp. Leaf61]|uniref:oligosaccharide flippase family protein n=1 Tax=Duganella sp. Leaf61 TaxID=1736227 RepID=UPI0007003B4F|nr:oligosaccharide flippase family protein [Duganella sp. Leaf61]KQN68991.1 hypothetical protein ASF04_15625 [Duganella sp. Leaf61]